MTGEIEREHRKRVRIMAEMRVDSKRVDVVICNVSSRGLMLAAEQVPPRGSYIEVSRAGVVTAARVMWASQGRFGVRTHDKLNVAAMTLAQGRAACMCLDACNDAAPEIRTMGCKTYVHGLHHIEHRAARSGWIAARMQFLTIAAGVALFAALGAFVTWELLSGVADAVAAGFN